MPFSFPGGLSDEHIEEVTLPYFQNDVSLHISIAETNGKIGVEDWLTFEKAVLNENLPIVSEAIKKVIGKLGVKALPVLEKAIVNEDWRIRIGAIWFAAEMGIIAWPILKTAIEDENQFVRKAAVRAIEGRSGWRSLGVKRILYILKKAMLDESPEVRRVVARVIVWTPQEAREEVLSILKILIEDEILEVRNQAARAASQMGDKALALLEKDIIDKSWYAIRPAVETARNIDTDTCKTSFDKLAITD